VDSLHNWLHQQGLSIVQEQPLSGGCVAETKCVTLNNGQQLFVKSIRSGHGQMFIAEAQGLEALSACAEITVPEVILSGSDGLVLEYIEQGQKAPDFDSELGRQLAALHRLPVPSFGFTHNSFCGPTEQINTPATDGYAFYAQQRFGYLAQTCYDKGLVDKTTYTGIESIMQRLPQLVPEQEPALLHGDLWSGNAIADRQGHPVLIDPAVYWGWPEADLAMTELFGGFSADLYSAYSEVSPLLPGWKQRIPLYNLWHLLNHLLLFGGSYQAEVMAVVAKFR